MSQESPLGMSHMTAHAASRGPYTAKAHITRQLRAVLPVLSQVQHQNNKPLGTTAWKVLPYGCRTALGSQSRAKAQAHCPGPPMPAACKHTYHHRKSCHLETTATETGFLNHFPVEIACVCWIVIVQNTSYKSLSGGGQTS